MESATDQDTTDQGQECTITIEVAWVLEWEEVDSEEEDLEVDSEDIMGAYSEGIMVVDSEGTMLDIVVGAIADDCFIYVLSTF
jgi:ribose 5-phosphate isomerase